MMKMMRNGKMSNLKMNCGYCGRKCSLDKDFCIPQDSVYICKSCYDWKQKVDDIEAKLAESKEQLIAINEKSNKIKKESYYLKQQLAEKDGELYQIYSHLGVEAFGEDIHEQALKEIAEKDELLRQKIGKMKLTDFIRMCKECGFMVQTKEIDNQTAIEELEQLKHDIWTNQHDDGWLDEKVDIYELTEMIDQQIKKLKGEK